MLLKFQNQNFDEEQKKSFDHEAQLFCTYNTMSYVQNKHFNVGYSFSAPADIQQLFDYLNFQFSPWLHAVSLRTERCRHH